MNLASLFRTLFRAPLSSQLTQLRDRDLVDLGLPRSMRALSAGHAPFDVPNDRT